MDVKQMKRTLISIFIIITIFMIIYGYGTYYIYKFGTVEPLTPFQNSILVLSKAAIAFIPFVIQAMTLILFITSIVITSQSLQAQIKDINDRQIPNVIIKQTTYNEKLDVLEIEVVNISKLLAYDLEVEITKDFYDIINECKQSDIVERIIGKNNEYKHNIARGTLGVSDIAKARIFRKEQVFKNYEKYINIPAKAITCFPDSPIYIQFTFDTDYYKLLKSKYDDGKIRIIVSLKYKNDINAQSYEVRKIPTILYD